MSDYTFGHKKAGTSTFSNPSLVSPHTPTLANPVRGFRLPTNNVIQTATEVSTDLQEAQSADEQSLKPEAIKEKPITHDISRFVLRRPQAKLTVGEPGDKYEQEADWMANQVMRMVVADKLNDPSVQPVQDSLQRKCAACEEEDKVQTKPSIQPATDGGLQAGDNIENRLSSSKGGGSPLPDEVRGFMEPRFDADFSIVRVHTGSDAVQMNRELGAQAFTYGSDIYFDAGKSPGNNELTAHELTHVVQQQGDGFLSPSLIQRDDSGDQNPTPTAPTQDQNPTPSSSGAITLPEINIVAVPPASLRSDIGTMNYYRKRNADFMSRSDVGETPPDYYLNYGDKYVNQFKTVLRPQLSSTGQKWLDCTLLALQTAIEDQRDANPWVFAEMERNNDKFRDFAYGTHSTAYVDCGVCELPIDDQIKIVWTPDLKDLLSLGGVGQILDSFAMCNAVWFYPKGP